MGVFSFLSFALLAAPGFAAEPLKVKVLPHVLECSTKGGCKGTEPAPEPQVITLDPKDCQGPEGARVCTALHSARFEGFGQAYRAMLVLFSYEEEGRPLRWSISASVVRDNWMGQNGVSIKMPELKLYQELSISVADTYKAGEDPWYTGVFSFGPAE